MRNGVFTQVAIAAVAAMPSAYPGIEATSTSPSSANLSDPRGKYAVLSSQGMASPTPESASPLPAVRSSLPSP